MYCVSQLSFAWRDKAADWSDWLVRLLKSLVGRYEALAWAPRPPGPVNQLGKEGWGKLSSITPWCPQGTKDLAGGAHTIPVPVPLQLRWKMLWGRDCTTVSGSTVGLTSQLEPLSSTIKQIMTFISCKSTMNPWLYFKEGTRIISSLLANKYKLSSLILLSNFMKLFLSVNENKLHFNG